jgi:hypothetical protein
MKKQAVFFVGMFLFVFMLALMLPISAQPPMPGRPTAGATRPQRPDTTPQIPEITLTPRSTADYRATAQVLSTGVHLDDTFIQATVNALTMQIPSLDTSLPADDLTTLIETFLTTGGVIFDLETNSLTVTSMYTEMMVNAAVEAALLTAGYNPSQVSVDLVYGAVKIIVTDVELNSQLKGTLILTVALTAVDGTIQIELVSATINNIQIPQSLLSEIEVDDVFAEAMNVADSVDLELSYSIDEITITDQEILVVITVMLPNTPKIGRLFDANGVLRYGH